MRFPHYIRVNIRFSHAIFKDGDGHVPFQFEDTLRAKQTRRVHCTSKFPTSSEAKTNASQTISARRWAANGSEDLYISLYPGLNFQLLGKSLSIHRPNECEWDIW